jgi:hypothetical protein
VQSHDMRHMQGRGPSALAWLPNSAQTEGAAPRNILVVVYIFLNL